MIYLSDDISEMQAALDEARDLRYRAKRAMEAADTGDVADWPEYDAAAAVFAKTDYEAEMLARHLWELEAQEALTNEWTENRVRWASVL